MNCKPAVKKHFMATNPVSSPPPLKPRGIRDRWRAKTNYNKRRFSGFAPISYAMVAEVGRLTAGKATQLVYVILAASLGQYTSPENNEPFKETAADLKTSELAELCNCDVKTIQRELGDLKHRGVILWEQSKKGVNVVTALFRHWSELPDYKPAPVLEPEPEDEDEPEEETAATPKETTVVTTKPVYVKAGRKSKRVPVTCGVASLEFEVQGRLDAECSAVVQDGVLRVILESKWDAKKAGNVTLETKGIEEKPRHSRGISPSVHSGSAKRNKGESHPRAAEISSLFDDLLLKWCGKSLSGSPNVLLDACAAIADTPHDVVVHAVIERSERELKLTHVVPLCRQIAHDWLKSKDLPKKKPLPTRQEINAMIERENAELAAKRAAAKRGRVA